MRAIKISHKPVLLSIRHRCLACHMLHQTLDPYHLDLAEVYKYRLNLLPICRELHNQPLVLQRMIMVISVAYVVQSLFTYDRNLSIFIDFLYFPVHTSLTSLSFQPSSNKRKQQTEQV